MLKDGPQIPDWTVAMASKKCDGLVASWSDGLEWQIPNTASGQSAVAKTESKPGRCQVYKGTTSDGVAVIAKHVSHRNKGDWYQVLAGRQQVLQVGPAFDAAYWSEAGQFVSDIAEKYATGSVTKEQMQQAKADWLIGKTTDDRSKTCVVKRPTSADEKESFSPPAKGSQGTKRPAKQPVMKRPAKKTTGSDVGDAGGDSDDNGDDDDPIDSDRSEPDPDASPKAKPKAKAKGKAKASGGAAAKTKAKAKAAPGPVGKAKAKARTTRHNEDNGATDDKTPGEGGLRENEDETRARDEDRRRNPTSLLAPAYLQIGLGKSRSEVPEASNLSE